MNQNLEHYMVKSPYVAQPDSSPKEALEFMRECDIRHLPIVKNQRLKGIVSERDLREALALPQADLLKIGDVMKTDVYVVSRQSQLVDVVRNMAEKKLGSAIVVNDRNEVIGIFTTTDALRLFADYLDDDRNAKVLSIEDYFESWTPERSAS
jgi:CBS domain-containing protein